MGCGERWPKTLAVEAAVDATEAVELMRHVAFALALVSERLADVTCAGLLIVVSKRTCIGIKMNLPCIG